MIGETIGNFRIASRLGRGGMGEVWLAEQRNIGTRVAVKLLLPEISEDAEHVQRFFNEARAVSRIQHAGIVKIFDVGHHSSGHAYLVMEFLDGETLGHRIRRAGPMALADVAEFGRQIASVLDATHSAGITHRDLKPDNIFIVPDRELASRQRIKVLDFGIAKLSGTLAHISPRTIGTMGTPAYMAPEQWGDASRVDHRADIYSLGCVLFEMACGRPPFLVTTMAEACGKHLTEPPPLAHSLVPEVPDELDELLAACLEKRPEDRPASMTVVERRFEAVARLVGPPSPLVWSAERDIATTADAGASTQLRSQRDLGATVATEPPAPRPGFQPAPASAPHDRARTDARTRSRRGITLGVAAAVLIAGGVVVGLALGRDTPSTGSQAKAGTGADAGAAAGSRAVVAGGVIDAAAARTACVAGLPRHPSVVGESQAPVTLAYLRHTGQRSRVSTELRLETKVRIDDDQHTDDTSVRYSGTIAWQQTVGSLTVERLGVDRVGVEIKADAPPRHTTSRWRSEDRDPSGDLESLRAVLHRTIKVTLDPRGAIVADDLEGTRGAIKNREGNSGSLLAAAITRDRVFQPMFIELPTHAIGPGDTFRAGEQIERLWWGATVVAQFELRVTAISAGGKQVLLEAAPDLAIDLDGSIANLSQHATLAMWVIFDRERGEVIGSATRACIDVKMRRDGKQVDAAAVLSSTFQTEPLEATAPSAPDPATPRAPRPHRGELPQVAVLKSVGRLSPLLRRCGPKGTRIAPHVAMTITIAGRAEQIEVTRVAAPVARCLAGVLAEGTYPTPKGGDADVSFPLASMTGTGDAE